MGWYKLIFKQNQPIHIGSTKWGVVKETEIFITGQTMWGALVNAYILEKGISDKDEIKNIQQAFEKITNFFPKSGEDGNVLLPNYKDGEFHLGDIPESKFRFYFVETNLQTAIEPLSRQAKDESLHEFDYILPRPKYKVLESERNEFLTNFENLYWEGLIFIEDDKYKEFFKLNKLKIFIGPDTRYGFGELELKEKKPLNKEELKFWQIYGDEIKINNEETKVPKSSLYFIEAGLIDKFEGKLQLIPEFDFTQNIPMVKDARFFVSVGSKLNENKEFDIKQLKKGKIHAQNP